MGCYGGYSYKSPKDGSLCKYEKYYPEITDEGVNDLMALMEIVYNSHFLYIKDDFLVEDMWGSALVKMMEFIKSGRFDPARGCLKNALYTVCRNEMKNVIYRNGRDFPVEDEVMATNESPSITVSLSAITLDNVKVLRGDDKSKVESSLRNMGFIVEGGTNNTWYPEVERSVAYAIWCKLRRI